MPPDAARSRDGQPGTGTHFDDSRRRSHGTNYVSGAMHKHLERMYPARAAAFTTEDAIAELQHFVLALENTLDAVQQALEGMQAALGFLAERGES